MTTRIDRRIFLGPRVSAPLYALPREGDARRRRSSRSPVRVSGDPRAGLPQQRLRRPHPPIGPRRRRRRGGRQDVAADPGNRSDRADRARDKFARLFGAKNEEIALLYSTSDGENVVTAGLDWKPGDNVVLDELHFQTSFVLYRELERTKGSSSASPLRAGAGRESRTSLRESTTARVSSPSPGSRIETATGTI